MPQRWPQPDWISIFLLSERVGSASGPGTLYGRGGLSTPVERESGARTRYAGSDARARALDKTTPSPTLMCVCVFKAPRTRHPGPRCVGDPARYLSYLSGDGVDVTGRSSLERSGLGSRLHYEVSQTLELRSRVRRQLAVCGPPLAECEQTPRTTSAPCSSSRTAHTGRTHRGRAD